MLKTAMKKKVVDTSYTVLKDFEKLSVSKNGIMTVYNENDKQTEK
jgi:hypothetical protein